MVLAFFLILTSSCVLASLDDAALRRSVVETNLGKTWRTKWCSSLGVLFVESLLQPVFNARPELKSWMCEAHTRFVPFGTLFKTPAKYTVVPSYQIERDVGRHRFENLHSSRLQLNSVADCRPSKMSFIYNCTNINVKNIRDSNIIFWLVDNC